MQKKTNIETIYARESASTNKGLPTKKGGIVGFVMGVFISLSVINTSFISVALLIAPAFLDYHLKKMWSFILGLSIILLIWIVSKWWLVDNVGKHIIQDIFLITVLTFFSIFNFKYYILNGLIVALSSLVLLDFSSNILQITIGNDFFGNAPITGREDGIRLVGIFGHSFISLGLYLSLFLLLQAAGFKRLVAYIPLLLMLMIGSFRAYIFFPLLIFCSAIFFMRWRPVFFTILIIPLFVATSTILSVSEEFLPGTSGNAFRVFAWKNAADIIQKNPLVGIDMAPIPLSDEFAVTEQNLIDYQIYESNFLQDAVRYGLPFVFIKLMFFYCIGIVHYKRRKKEIKHLDYTKNFIMVLLIVDYFVFSYFGMPALAMIAGIILGTKEYKLYNNKV